MCSGGVKATSHFVELHILLSVTFLQVVQMFLRVTDRVMQSKWILN